VTVAERDGKTSYVYADLTHYQIFVGAQSQYQRYQQLQLTNNLAQKNLEASELNQRTDIGGDVGVSNPLYKP
jgi:hypothetical protein